MPEKVVLFDVDNSLVSEAKDVSDYYFESIRFVYGLSIDNIRLSDYKGLTVYETLTSILDNRISKSEIDEKFEQFVEELPYGHYNVAGHDSARLADGAKSLLNNLKKNERYAVGAASGQLQRILKNMFDRGGLNYDNYFVLGAYGNTNETMKEVLIAALDISKREFNVNETNLIFVSNVGKNLSEAKSLGMYTVGIQNAEKINADKVVKNLKDCERLLSVL